MVPRRDEKEKPRWPPGRLGVPDALPPLLDRIERARCLWVLKSVEAMRSNDKECVIWDLGESTIEHGNPIAEVTVA